MEQISNNDYILVKEISETIAKGIVKTMAPDEIENVGIVVEEYLEWNASKNTLSGDQRLGIMGPEVMQGFSAASTWIAAIVCAVVVDYIKKMIDKNRNPADDMIQIISANAYNMARQLGIEKDKALQLCNNMKKSLIENKESISKIA